MVQIYYMAFVISERLIAGGFDFGSCLGCRVLLKNNAHYPWFVIVPEVEDEIVELTDLNVEQYEDVMHLVYGLSLFIKDHFEVAKVNLGCVGIVVPQLHLHVVGRTEGDPAWPGVVWGDSEKKQYEQEEVDRIKELFKAAGVMGLFQRRLLTKNQ